MVGVHCEGEDRAFSSSIAEQQVPRSFQSAAKGERQGGNYKSGGGEIETERRRQ